MVYLSKQGKFLLLEIRLKLIIVYKEFSLSFFQSILQFLEKG